MTLFQVWERMKIDLEPSVVEVFQPRIVYLHSRDYVEHMQRTIELAVSTSASVSLRRMREQGGVQ